VGDLDQIGLEGKPATDDLPQLLAREGGGVFKVLNTSPIPVGDQKFVRAASVRIVSSRL